MRRFYLPPEECRDDAGLILSGKEAHHAASVLRMKSGDRVCVLDGVGGVFSCSVRHATRKQVDLEIMNKRTFPPPRCAVTLVQSIPKGKIMEFIVQKATELGVSRIVPLLSQRSEVRYSSIEARRKTSKWRQTAIEAIKQCGSPWLPEISLPLSLETFLRPENLRDLELAASLRERAASLRTQLDHFRNETGIPPASISVWIGPEGDFTEGEYEALANAGIQEITLGHLTLRSDTAALYCLSVIQYELGCGSPVE